jgi:pimeloyl-ACP methyl ester carboxylesterase
MKAKVLLSAYFIIASILFACGQADKSENVAISTDGIEIRFDQQGEGELTLIFVHGWANYKGIWDPQMSHFSQKYRVVAVDLPGFGESGYNRTDWTMAAFGEDVNAVIKKLNPEQVVLIGFSMGAPVVIEAAKQAPENLVGLVLADEIDNIEMKYTPEMLVYLDSVFMDIAINPTNEKLLAGGFYKKNPEASYERVVSMLSLSAQNNTSRIGWRELISEIFRWLNDDCIEALQKVQAPVTSISSDTPPTNVEALEKYVSSYTLKVIPDVGHLVMWDNPDEFNRLLEESIQEFLNESESSPE